jgi:hypothetical protein
LTILRSSFGNVEPNEAVVLVAAAAVADEKILGSRRSFGSW